MNVTLLKALLAFILVCLLITWSVVVVRRDPTVWRRLQLLGSVGLLLVVFAHICEALHLLPFMHWGAPHSVGHYLDFTSAVLGFSLLGLGLVMHLVTRHGGTPDHQR